MTSFQLSLEEESDLDSIWLYIARESSSIDGATQAVERIAERFWLLARYPYAGRPPG